MQKSGWSLTIVVLLAATARPAVASGSAEGRSATDRQLLQQVVTQIIDRELAQAEPTAERVRRSCEEAGDLPCLAQVHLLLGKIADLQQRYPKSLADYRAAATLWQRLEQPVGIWVARYARGELFRFLGQLRVATEELEASRAALKEDWGAGRAPDLSPLQGLIGGMGFDLSAAGPHLRSLPARMVLGQLESLTTQSLVLVWGQRGDHARTEAELALLDRYRGPLGGASSGSDKIRIELVLLRGGDWQQAEKTVRREMERLRQLRTIGGSLLEEILPPEAPVFSLFDQQEFELTFLLCRILGRQGKIDEAFEELGAAAEIAARRGEPSEQLAVDLAGVELLMESGDFERVLEWSAAVSERARELGFSLMEADARLRMGTALAVLDRPVEALQQLLAARQQFAEVGARRHEGAAVLLLASLAAVSGGGQRAGELIQQAAAIAEEIDDPRLLTEVRLAEVNVRLQWDADGWSAADERIAQEVVELASSAMSAADRLTEPHLQTAARIGLGRAHLIAAQPAAALGVVEEGLALARRTGQPIQEAQLLLLRAAGQLRLDRLDDAKGALGEAGKLAEALGSLRLIGGVRFVQGELLIRRGERRQGLALIEEGVSTLQEAHAALGASPLSLGLGNASPDRNINRLIGLYADDGDAAAFRWAEQARGQLFLRRLGWRWLSGAPGAAGELVKLRRAVTEAEARLATRSDSRELVSPQVLQLSRSVETARSTLHRAVVALEAQQPAVLRRSGLRSATLEEIQASLPAAGSLVMFHTLPGRTLIWVVTASRLQMIEAPVCCSDLLSSTSSLLNELDPDGEGGGERPQGPPEAAVSLYEQLWRPLEPWLDDGPVLLSLNRSLHSLPFQALYDQRTGRYLGQQRALSRVPSGSVLVALDRRRKAGEFAASVSDQVLVAAHSGTGPERLDNALAEAASVAALYGVAPLTGASASEAAVRQRAVTSRLVHLAAHGGADTLGSPLHHRILLAPGEGHDGRLEVHEILSELDLRSAPLVVLSACRTAGGELLGGEEITSLPRALLLAGASGVVATHWRVDDRATFKLMERFHSELAGGVLPAEALRRARAALIASDDLSSPRFWAAFELFGLGLPGWSALGEPIGIDAAEKGTGAAAPDGEEKDIEGSGRSNEWELAQAERWIEDAIALQATDQQAARLAVRRACTTYRRIGHRLGEGRCLLLLASDEDERIESALAAELLERSARLLTDAGDPLGAWVAELSLGAVLLDLDESQAALDASSRAVQALARLDDLAAEEIDVTSLELLGHWDACPNAEGYRLLSRFMFLFEGTFVGALRSLTMQERARAELALERCREARSSLDAAASHDGFGILVGHRTAIEESWNRRCVGNRTSKEGAATG